MKSYTERQLNRMTLTADVVLISLHNGTYGLAQRVPFLERGEIVEYTLATKPVKVAKTITFDADVMCAIQSRGVNVSRFVDAAVKKQLKF